MMLFEWNRGFNKESLPAIMTLTEEYKDKRSNREIMQYVGKYMKSVSR
ncbi:hypothetical protein [Paenibacillus sp. MMS20-IR301]|nr:hypothetical protein [Paenibacillus sp. MMS20-IR301]WNS41132.1 hypothetical protein LOS79_19035 [Paenibacillus sp. MMS20-IR301]